MMKPQIDIQKDFAQFSIEYSDEVDNDEEELQEKEDGEYLKNLILYLCREANKLEELPNILNNLQKRGYLDRNTAAHSNQWNISSNYFSNADFMVNPDFYTNFTSLGDVDFGFNADDDDSRQIPGTNFEKNENLNTSIYKMDEQLSQYYNVLGELGSGSYGKVIKIQNLIDKHIYALKTIRINREEAPFAFREIQALALINSPRVVRYFCSWVQNINDSNVNTECINEDLNECLNDELNVDLNDNTNINNFSNNTEEVDLCIQMEYVPGQNLSDYIQTRQNVDYHYCLFLFREMAIALKDIHKYGVVHRDFSPSNIILNSDGGISVIDFGISSLRHSGIIETTENCINNSTYTDNNELKSFNCINDISRSCSEPISNSLSQYEKYHSLSPLSSFAFEAVNPNNGKYKTVQELGTPPYASPHQMHGGKSKTYDDIYSLGIITFELFMVFQTGMERARSINELKTSHTLPTSFTQRYPELTQLILSMTDSDARKRPSAANIARNRIFNEIFNMYD
ncbi:AGC family protein kinase [Tritrichomonas foetus]|uniref:AGC family protein kinase n=1 Tax=Tritrichomonas foetus TaxID=1144522 RepID=A0A1J4KNR9_9EUKA|nr:AGC family protein kinase [Tritrichomonas foetus]|eukprot:OHT12927.1 AGC family protein kinase [Tritrichomonas foetus]